jgi:hypothetical protein
LAPNGEELPVVAIRPRRTKTSSADAGEGVLVVGRPVDALRAWLAISKIDAGPVFRRIDKWGNIGAVALDPQSVNAMIKSRCAAAGLSPGQFSAPGCVPAISPKPRARACRCPVLPHFLLLP